MVARICFFLAILFSITFRAFAGLPELIEADRQASRDLGFLEGLCTAPDGMVRLGEIRVTDYSSKYAQCSTRVQCRAEANYQLGRALEVKLGRSLEKDELPLSFGLKHEIEKVLLELKRLNGKYNPTLGVRLSVDVAEPSVVMAAEKQAIEELYLPTGMIRAVLTKYRNQFLSKRNALVEAIEAELKSGEQWTTLFEPKLRELFRQRSDIQLEVEKLKLQKQELSVELQSQSQVLEELNETLNIYRAQIVQVENELITFTATQAQVHSDWETATRVAEGQYQERLELLSRLTVEQVQEQDIRFQIQAQESDEMLQMRAKKFAMTHQLKVKEHELGFSRRMQEMVTACTTQRRDLEMQSELKQKELTYLTQQLETKKREVEAFERNFAACMAKGRTQYAEDRVVFENFEPNVTLNRFKTAFVNKFKTEILEYQSLAKRERKPSKSPGDSGSDSSFLSTDSIQPKHHITVFMKSFRKKSGLTAGDWYEVSFTLSAQVIHFCHQEDEITSETMTALVNSNGELKGDDKNFNQALTKFVRTDLHEAKTRAIQYINSSGGQRKLQDLEADARVRSFLWNGASIGDGTPVTVVTVPLLPEDAPPVLPGWALQGGFSTTERVAQPPQSGYLPAHVDPFASAHALQLEQRSSVQSKLAQQ